MKSHIKGHQCKSSLMVAFTIKSRSLLENDGLFIPYLIVHIAIV